MSCLPPLRVLQNRTPPTQQEVCRAMRLHRTLSLCHVGVLPLLLEVWETHSPLPRQARRSADAGGHEELQTVFLFLLVTY